MKRLFRFKKKTKKKNRERDNIQVPAIRVAMSSVLPSSYGEEGGGSRTETSSRADLKTALLC